MSTQFLKIVSLSLAMTSFSVQTLAQPPPGRYAPYTFADSFLAQRTDIKDFAPKLRLNSNFPLAQFDSVQFSQVELQFFSEIAEQMKSLAQNQTTVPFKQSHSPLCEAHERFKKDGAKISQSCHNDLKLTQILEQLDQGCEELSYPELTLKKSSILEVKRSQFENLEGLIDFAGQFLFAFELPQAWQQNQLVQPMRVILQKIKKQTLLKRARQNSDLYSEVLSKTTSPSCQIATTSLLKKMQNETATQMQNILQLEADGIKQAELDRQAIVNSGRQRESLPYPSLTDRERQQLSLMLGSFYWRLRGGGIVDAGGTQKARFFFNFEPMGVLGSLNGLAVGQTAAEAQTAALVLKGWGKFFDMGHTPGQNDVWYDLVHMTDRGRYQVQLASEILSAAGYDPFEFLAGGEQMGPCYFYAWQSLSQFNVGENLPSPLRTFIDGPTAWGEICTGGSISLGLSKSLLKGHL